MGIEDCPWTQDDNPCPIKPSKHLLHESGEWGPLMSHMVCPLRVNKGSQAAAYARQCCVYNCISWNPWQIQGAVLLRENFSLVDIWRSLLHAMQETPSCSDTNQGCIGLERSSRRTFLWYRPQSSMKSSYTDTKKMGRGEEQEEKRISSHNLQLCLMEHNQLDQISIHASWSLMQPLFR